jgi:hypothetical protein
LVIAVSKNPGATTLHTTTLVHMTKLRRSTERSRNTKVPLLTVTLSAVVLNAAEPQYLIEFEEKKPLSQKNLF